MSEPTYLTDNRGSLDHLCNVENYIVSDAPAAHQVDLNFDCLDTDENNVFHNLDDANPMDIDDSDFDLLLNWLVSDASEPVVPPAGNTDDGGNQPIGVLLPVASGGDLHPPIQLFHAHMDGDIVNPGSGGPPIFSWWDAGANGADADDPLDNVFELAEDVVVDQDPIFDFDFMFDFDDLFESALGGTNWDVAASA